MQKLEIEHLTKHYWLERYGREVLALEDISITVGDGEFMAIVGPSGCGKTTLLNIVAGLLPYEEGTVRIDGRPGRIRSPLPVGTFGRHAAARQPGAGTGC